MRVPLTAIVTIALAAPTAALAQSAAQNQATTPANQKVDAEVISLSDWRYDDLYRSGWSADEFIDEVEVYGPTGDEIGDVEDILVGSDGRIVSVIAEVGGFWDMGDTHVSVPWDEIEFDDALAGITVPVAEDNVDRYDVYHGDIVSRSDVSQDITGDMDNTIAGARIWRISELIGDYARLSDGEDGYTNYGYVNDVIMEDGNVKAIVVQPNTSWGMRGDRAYPFYGYGYGWTPGRPTYDLPYTRDEIADMAEFDRTQMQ